MTTTPENEDITEVSLSRRFFRPQTLISFAVAFVILYFLLTRMEIDMEETRRILGDTDLFLISLSFLLYYLTFPLRGWRWRVLLRNVGFDDPPSTRDLTEITFLSYFVNNIVPAKLGDVYRGYLLKRSAGLSFSKSMGTIVSERIIALIVLFVMVGITSLIGFHGHLPETILQTLGIALALVLVAAVGLLAMKGGRKFIQNILPARLRPLYAHFEEGLFLSFRRFPLLLLLTILIWGMEGGRFFFAASALNLAIDPMTSLFIALGSALLTTLPFTPSGLGIVESAIVAVLLLASSLGLVQEMSKSQALSVALLDRLVCYWGLILLGLVVYILSRKTK